MSNAEAWVTYSSLSVAMDHALGERDGAVGLLEANILLADASDLPALSEELRREVRRYNSGLSEGQVVCEEPLSYADNLLSGLFGPETYIVLGMALLLFLLVPALNLSGMNASRIQERVGELGIRKAFGATKATLMGAGLRGEYGADAARGAWRGCSSPTCWCSSSVTPSSCLGSIFWGRAGMSSSAGDAAQYVGLRVRLRGFASH